MVTIRRRIETLERTRRNDGSDDRRDLVEAVNRASGDAEFIALVDDLRNAACREDSDPTLPHQRGLGIRDGPPIEEIEGRLVRRLEELEAMRNGALG